MQIDANTLAEEAYQEIDGLMVLVGQTDGQIDFLTGSQLYFLLQPIRDHLGEIRRLTSGPPPAVSAAAVLPFTARR